MTADEIPTKYATHPEPCAPLTSVEAFFGPGPAPEGWAFDPTWPFDPGWPHNWSPDEKRRQAERLYADAFAFYWIMTHRRMGHRRPVFRCVQADLLTVDTTTLSFHHVERGGGYMPAARFEFTRPSKVVVRRVGCDQVDIYFMRGRS